MSETVTEPAGEADDRGDSGDPGGEPADGAPCGCDGPCEHAPRIEEFVLPSRRPAEVGVMAIDRRGLVELARRRGVEGLATRR